MRTFNRIVQDIKAPNTSDLWINSGKLKYFDGGWKDLGVPDLSDYATKEDLNDYLSLTGGEITGTLGVYNLALTNASLGALVQLIGTQNQFSINTLNAGVNTFLFNIQNSTPLKLTSAGVYVTGNIYENNIALEDKYVLLTDIATTGAAGLMSADDKSKLDGIAMGANNYVHPTTSGNIHIPSGGSSGQILRWSADGTAVWGDDNNTTYSDATQSTAGLMSAADKTKLDNIASNANNYTLPNASTSVRGGVLMAGAVADTTVDGTETATTVATTLNSLLAALRTAGVLTA